MTNTVPNLSIEIQEILSKYVMVTNLEDGTWKTENAHIGISMCKYFLLFVHTYFVPWSPPLIANLKISQEGEIRSNN